MYLSNKVSTLINRIVHSYTLGFIKYLLGFRKAYTSLTSREHEILSVFAKGKKCIIEVGVFEGTTSKIFCQSMDSGGKLYLIDPYFLELRLEKLLNFSFPQFIAKREIRKWNHQVKFIRQTSVEAAHTLLKSQIKAELIFIDAKHDYYSVLEDFKIW
ncbi:MAG: class I SAM-dependent methyltransferase, partial [Elusimicrobiota bacterium]